MRPNPSSELHTHNYRVLISTARMESHTRCPVSMPQGREFPVAAPSRGRSGPAAWCATAKDGDGPVESARYGDDEEEAAPLLVVSSTHARTSVRESSIAVAHATQNSFPLPACRRTAMNIKVKIPTIWVNVKKICGVS